MGRYGLPVPVGTVAVLMADMTARSSFRVGAAAVGAPTAMGAGTADGLYAVAAVLGGAALAAVIQLFPGSLRWASAAMPAAMASTMTRRYKIS